MRGTVLAVTLVTLLTGSRGQSVDSVVRDAVNSAFSGSTSGRRITGGTLIPTVSTGSTNPPTQTTGGSSAINAHNRFSQSNSPEMNRMLDDRSSQASTAARNIAASPIIASGTRNTDEAHRKVISDPEITASFQRAMAPFCYEMPVCDTQNPYRTADGSCNNLYNPLLGKAFTPQARILQNHYDNFIDTPRTLTSNRQSKLPGAREVSNAVLSGSTPTSSIYSTFLTHFGQFIDHDIIATPSMTEGNPPRTITDCCNPLVNKFACFTIPVPRGDPHFPPTQTCMNMVRHSAALPLGCTNGVREQQNQRSSFIDGTAIYGFNNEREMELRQRSGGRLKTSDIVRGLLPRATCPMGISTQYHCFIAGDHRQSETPTLTVMHTIWMRRHNLIADALRASTRITDDEVLFQEAKRIVVAELQHVTYNEFLPAVLDKTHLNYFNLRSRQSGHDSYVYNPSVDPRTFNAFGAAVLRMGHSLVRNIVGQDNGRQQIRTFPLSNHFENPDLMFSPRNGFEFMARWMAKSPKSQADSSIVDGLRNRLFEGTPGQFPSETTSFDLGALNIQRGREHGLPSYNAYRQYCGRYPASHFGTSSGGLVDHSPQDAANLAAVYRSTDDIDLFAGGMSERPIYGGILGPTFSCLFALQFSRYKHGDRFWYENDVHENPLTAFTTGQLDELKQVTLAKILCSVVKDDGFKQYQPRLLLRPDITGNSLRPCSKILNRYDLGYDIRPFADQLNSLRSRRTSSRFPSFPGAFQRSAARGGSTSQTSIPPTNVGFKIPNPADVLRNVTSTSTSTGSQGGGGVDPLPNNRGQRGRRRNNRRRNNKQNQRQGTRKRFQGRF
ncbi:peroxidase-like protein [Saccostrea cucullata]|uniref:peroxidase-like protein n=1 Tax=Saccostrea cuccullata TaxID=36930 RepID=UPI002ED07BC9